MNESPANPESRTDGIDDRPSTAKPLLARPTPAALRVELHEAVVRDLLGPVQGPEEELAEPTVHERYLVGTLAPRHRLLEPEQFDELAEAGAGEVEEGTPDSGGLPSATMFPATIGFTFCVDGAASALHVRAAWGWYRRAPSEHLTSEKTGNPRQVWKRTPIEAEENLPLTPGKLEDWHPNPDQPEVVVRGIARKRPADTEWTITLFLINGQREPKQSRDTAWLFQPELNVSAPDGAPIFTRRNTRRTGDKLDAQVFAELQALEMLYRLQPEFAVGHGVSVHAEPSPSDPLRAVRLSTRTVPQHEVPRVTPPTAEDISALGDLVRDMKVLAETEATGLREKLQPLVDAYGEWIKRQRTRIATGADGLGHYRKAAEEALDRCDKARQRIEAGIQLVSTDPQAADAFRFMNRAMWKQRVHARFAEETRRGLKPTLETIDVPVQRSWHPFQIAFILLNLPSLTDLQHPDRDGATSAVADLLWYPTGGGKTESYLGLTAYTLAVRRLQGKVGGRSGEHGVAVLMRYTLRLLTLQQFQRASALICACEAIRREAVEAGDLRWGRAPFRIGLWVGNKTTPNWFDESVEAIQQYHGHKFAGAAGDPAQLTYCPWCGSAIDRGKHIIADKGRRRTLIYCGDPLGRCPFSARRAPGEGLPVVVVDEEIYRLLPSLLIATVDKFAQMPWNGVVQTIFGQVNGFCPRHGFRSPDLQDSDSHPKLGDLPAVQSVPHGPVRPPDLIIQDELHLISGPLGSLVGLYETAVDHLATWEVDGKRVRPKVIASTATIRNAQSQVHRVFARRVSVFPPHGVDAGDNFFAVQRDPSDQHPGRLYLGICAPGKRLKAVLIRVYLAYLAAAQQLYERYGAGADPWTTLVGYFNSMRELGGMRRLVDDDINSRLRKMDERGLAKRTLRIVEELTSRKHSGDIPEILDRMEIPFDPGADERRKEQKAKGQKMDPFPIDVLLATNMLSVGVDVKRLGLMVVAGQPKTTAEYIQASSRVGRSFPGIVCTVLNWARPRDLSHFEQFEHYHATFYQYVEALSVTPFAPRAIDRGLAALLVACVRQAGQEYNPNPKAAELDRNHQFVDAAVKAIADRAWQTESKKAHDRVRAELEGKIDHWLTRAQKKTGGQTLGYQTKKDSVTVGLLQSPVPGGWEPFTCLNSLRDVEPVVNLVLDDFGMDRDEPEPAVPVEPEPQVAPEEGLLP